MPSQPSFLRDIFCVQCTSWLVSTRSRTQLHEQDDAHKKDNLQPSISPSPQASMSPPDPNTTIYHSFPRAQPSPQPISRPNPQLHSPLLRLPAEIRHQIWIQSLSGMEIYIIFEDRRCQQLSYAHTRNTITKHNLLGLSLSCRQMWTHPCSPLSPNHSMSIPKEEHDPNNHQLHRNNHHPLHPQYPHYSTPVLPHPLSRLPPHFAFSCHPFTLPPLVHHGTPASSLSPFNHQPIFGAKPIMGLSMGDARLVHSTNPTENRDQDGEDVGTYLC